MQHLRVDTQAAGPVEYVCLCVCVGGGVLSEHWPPVPYMGSLRLTVHFALRGSGVRYTLYLLEALR